MDGPTIKKMREMLKMTLQEFAHELHVGIATVWRWEKGRTKPSKHFQGEIQGLYDRKLKKSSVK